MKYRVLMQDTVNGQAFNFAMHYEATCVNDAFDQAKAEFSDVKVVEARHVAPTVKELLKDALTKLYSKAA